MRRTLISFISILILILALGFLGYYFGFLGFIYNVMMPEVFGRFPLVILAIIFGIAAFFSPCTFTVLPAYVSHYLSTATERRSARLSVAGIYFGLIAALGVITVDIIVGLIIAALGAATPFAKDPRQDIPAILAVRVLAGFVIAILGIITLTGRSLPIPFLHKLLSRAQGTKSVFLYGMLYNGAALGCTGPILLGLTLYAFNTGSVSAALTAFVIFALTMGLLMVLLTTAIAAAGAPFARRFLPATPYIEKFAGTVMLIVGLAIAILTLEGNRLFVKLFFPFLH